MMKLTTPDREKYLEIFNSIDFRQIKDHPNILIAARFWDDDRYHAAKVCYKFMRTIDDLIDDHKTKFRSISPDEQDEFRIKVEEWLKRLISSGGENLFPDELTNTIHRFRIPVWPMEVFAESMIYDIYHDGFPKLDSFLQYARGASVAPASIFVHLSGLMHENGVYGSPLFDVKEAATPCAIFSYLVHIVRDFQKDQLSNLNYFADDLILKYNLTHHHLREFAEGKPVNDDFRRMIGEYHHLADHYRMETHQVLKRILPLVEPRYQLGLHIIFNLYLLVFEKIDLKNSRFTSEELNPSVEETRERVFETIMTFKAC